MYKEICVFAFLLVGCASSINPGPPGTPDLSECSVYQGPLTITSTAVGQDGGPPVDGGSLSLTYSVSAQVWPGSILLADCPLPNVCQSADLQAFFDGIPAILDNTLDKVDTTGGKLCVDFHGTQYAHVVWPDDPSLPAETSGPLSTYVGHFCGVCQ